MAVKQAPADGYTLFLGTNTHLAVNPIVIKDLPYDPVKDLKPITGLARGMMIFVGNPQSKITNVADLVKVLQSPAPRLECGHLYRRLSFVGGLVCQRVIDTVCDMCLTRARPKCSWA